MTAPAKRGSVAKSIDDLTKRVRALEALSQIMETEKAVINVTTTGPETLVTNPAVGEAIRVISMGFLVACDTDVTFYSSGTPITGPIPFPERGGISQYEGLAGIIETAVDEDLNVTLSAACQMGGMLSYEFFVPE